MSKSALEYLEVALVTGEDAGDFLQAQLSADLTALQVDGASPACYCNASGRVIAVMLVVKKSDRWLLIMSNSLMETVLQTLRRYVLRAAVEFEQTSLLVTGSEESTAQADEFSISFGNLVLSYQVSQSGRDGDHIDTARASAWRSLELRAGLVWLSPQTSEKYLPQMLGLDKIGAVSFRKGCFPGQEVIARAQYLGKVKRLPLIARSTGGVPLLPGTQVELRSQSGETAGAAVVDCAVSHEDGMIVFLVTSADDEFQLAEIAWDGSTLNAQGVNQG